MKRTTLQKLTGKRNTLLALVRMGLKRYILDLLDIESKIEELTAKNAKLAVSKKRAIAFLKNKLSTNKAWALRALLVVYSGQTQAERIKEETSEHNGIGFTAFDAGLLSSFSLQYIETGTLSNKQLDLLFSKMPKYAGQLLALSDIEKLNKMLVE